MKKTFILSAVLILAIGFPAAYGAKLFLQKDKTAETTEQEALETPAPAPSTVPEPAPAPVAPATPNQAQDMLAFANGYYENCKTADHPYLKGPDLEMMCACTSARLPEYMSIEQVMVQQENSAEGQKQRNRMLLHVYGPCIEFPTRAMISHRCLNTPDVVSRVPNYKKVCGCLSDSMAEYMKENAPAAIQKSLTANPNDLDPLSTLMGSKDFDDQSQRFLQSCIMTHALK